MNQGRIRAREHRQPFRRPDVACSLLRKSDMLMFVSCIFDPEKCWEKAINSRHARRQVRMQGNEWSLQRVVSSESSPVRNANSSNLITRVSGSNENYPPTTLPSECEKGSQRVVFETHIPLATTISCLHHGLLPELPFLLILLSMNTVFPLPASRLIALASCW